MPNWPSSPIAPILTQPTRNAINDIFTMNPDGSGIVKLTHSDDVSDAAAWSPDGSKIAFGSDRRNGAWRREIYVMDADGSNVRRVSTLPANAELGHRALDSPRTGGGSCSPAT